MFESPECRLGKRQIGELYVTKAYFTSEVELETAPNICYLQERDMRAHPRSPLPCARCSGSSRLGGAHQAGTRLSDAPMFMPLSGIRNIFTDPCPTSIQGWWGLLPAADRDSMTLPTNRFNAFHCDAPEKAGAAHTTTKLISAAPIAPVFCYF
jgi:hypothetical protein